MPSDSAIAVSSRSFRDRFSELIHDRTRPPVQRRYLRLLTTRWKLILGVLLLAILAGVVWAVTATPLYRAEATIQIDPDDPEVLPYEQVSTSSYSGRESEEYLLTAAETLRSRSLAERVIRRLDLPSDPRFRRLAGGGGGGGDGAESEPADEAAAADQPVEGVRVFLANLGTNVLRKTRLIEISFRAPHPGLAATIVNTTIEEFIAQRLEQRNEDATAAIAFLRQQLEELEQAIEESRTELLAFARGSNEGLSDGGRTTLDKLDDLSSELTAIESELNSMSYDYAVALQASVDDFPASLATPTILELEKRLYELEREDARLAASFGPNWPEVQEVRSQLEQLRAQLVAEKEEAIVNVRRDYDKALDRRRRIESALDGQRRLVEQFNVDSLRYGILERRVQAREDLHTQLLDRLVEAYAEMELATSNIRVVSGASEEARPIYPRKRLGVMLAAGFGLLFGLGLAVAVDSVDDRVRDDLDVAGLELPLIGSIPSRQREDTPAAPPALPGAHAVRALQPAETALQASEMTYWEAVRALRTSILGGAAKGSEIPRTVMVTSALPGEGKTTTVAHVGIALARTGARTLMVDLNLRDPALNQKWQNVDGGGVTALLEGNGEVGALVQPTGVENLYLLPAGSPDSRSIDLLDSDRLAPGMQTLRSMFDFIIFDTPSLHRVNDALIVSRYADTVLVVIAAHDSSRAAVRGACSRLTRAGASILGIVLNRADAN